MKLTIVLPILASLAATITAETHLAPFDSSDIQKGKFYDVSWVNDKPDLLDLQLVQQTSNGWKNIQWIFIGKHAPPPGGSHSFPIFQDIPAGDGYALYLSGRKYYDITQWFSIAQGDE